MVHVRFALFVFALFQMHFADAHLRGQAAESLALLQTSAESVEAQVEATSVGRWGATHSNVLALLSGAPGAGLLATHEKMASMVGRQVLASDATGNEQPATSTLLFFTNLLIWILLVSAVAYYWHGRDVVAVDPGKTKEGFDDWKFHFCFWFEDLPACLCACCCPAIRWAETISFVPDLLAFWPAFFFFMLLLALTRIDFTGSFVCVFALVLMCTSYRQELRHRFGMKAGGVSYATDFLLHLFCMCCAITQEARQVEEALKSGHGAAMCPPDRKQASKQARTGCSTDEEELAEEAKVKGAEAAEIAKEKGAEAAEKAGEIAEKAKVKAAEVAAYAQAKGEQVAAAAHDQVEKAKKKGSKKK